MKSLAAASLAFSLTATPALAWWDGGHMQIAAVAYSKLEPDVRARADALIAMNPDYPQWIAGVPADRQAQYAFIHAAVWADDIKAKSDYVKDDATPTGDNSAGYGDKNMHRYWHYRDVRFSTDNSPFDEADPINAISQIKLFIAALPSTAGANDSVRSYDLVWLLHLVGDIHQPLHATERFSAAEPKGDRGGNEVKVRPATGEIVDLHAYWDRMFGGYVSVAGAIFDANDRQGIAKLTADPSKAAEVDPDKWLQESYELGRQFAYGEPVLTKVTDVSLTRDYETAARDTARSQAALAAARLANVINRALR